MSARLDLKAIEKRAYLSIWEDGLIDVFAGVALLGLGLFWLTDYAVFGGLLPALLIPFWPAARRWITVPRAGSVQFSRERRATERRKLSGLLFAGSATLLLGVALYFTVVRDGVSSREWLAAAIPALPGILLAFGATLTGSMIGARRFYAYGVLLVVGGGVGIWLRLEPGVYMAAAGAVILLAGLMMVVRFVRKYPIHGEAAR